MEVPSGHIAVPESLLKELLDRVDHLTALVEDLHGLSHEIAQREASKPEIDPRARYKLSFAADYLETSQSTLKRRAKEHRFVILYDERAPFVMGAEILRYAREGAKRKTRVGRPKKSSAT